jgi:hypothetical protein
MIMIDLHENPRRASALFKIGFENLDSKSSRQGEA